MMQKIAYSTTMMPSVTTQTIDDRVLIQIYLNGREVVSSGSEQTKKERQYEYDFNEIRCPIGALDLDDVQANPEKYLDYDYEAVTAQIRFLKQELADTDYISAKIADGAATRDEYAQELAQRESWRAEIRRLSGEGV